MQNLDDYDAVDLPGPYESGPSAAQGCGCSSCKGQDSPDGLCSGLSLDGTQSLAPWLFPSSIFPGFPQTDFLPEEPVEEQAWDRPFPIDPLADESLPQAGCCCGGGGTGRLVVVGATAAYSVNPGDGFIKADATAAAFTVTLPAAANAGAGWKVAVKKIDSSTNLVTVDGNGSETIDGLADLVLRRQYECVTVVSDGAGWWIETHST